MFNCHAHLKKFHNDCVSLTENMKQGMRARRDANRGRLARGIKKNNNIIPLKHVPQGSYAMHTMVQSEYDASDIDDGVVFSKNDLIGPKGGEYSPSDAKYMVRDAIINDNASFNTPPEVHTNCVRIFYNDGFTIDIPVYRLVEDQDGDNYYELASTEWKKSDPEGVTNWFNTQVVEKSPDQNNGRQMRRLAKLLKAWSKSRKSWNMPSGFITSKLIDEKYYLDESLLDRDDKALLQIMEAIQERLKSNLVVDHPVIDEKITKSDEDANMVELRDRLLNAITTLSILRRSDCTELDAVKALREIFNTNHFDQKIEELENEEKKSNNRQTAAGSITITGAEPQTPVKKEGDDKRYA